jgi:hypothetical protein
MASLKSNYMIKNGMLCVQEPASQRVSWEGSFEGLPVIQVLPLADEDGCLVLLDAAFAKTPTVDNLLKVGSDGSVVWKAQPRPHDSFTRIVAMGNRVVAQTWKGLRVEIDLTTGQTKTPRFVK